MGDKKVEIGHYTTNGVYTFSLFQWDEKKKQWVEITPNVKDADQIDKTMKTDKTKICGHIANNLPCIYGDRCLLSPDIDLNAFKIKLK